MGVNINAWVVFFMLLSLPVFAAEITLPDIVVTAQKQKQLADELPAVDGVKIYSGKKTSVIDLQQRPAIVNSNYRQALDKTSGLLVSEETTPLFSVGYRGLAPHRAQYTQVMKDGIPIHADMLGYPEAYYVPALDTVDHIDFVRGGGALLYGPQPGGALNFVTKDPYEGAPLHMETSSSGGSYGLFSNYTALSGSQDNIGYLGYFHHRQSQGFRAHNSQAEVYYSGGKLKYGLSGEQQLTLGFDAYNEKHGEPGGLTRADFDVDPAKANRLNDRFELNRYAGSLAYDNDIDEDNRVEVKFFGGFYERLSWRQRSSAASNFGTAPSGANASTNDIESQEFLTGGTDLRVKKDYAGIDGNENTLTAGLMYYHVTSPRLDKRGTTPDALDGAVRKDADRWMNYVSLFTENIFRLGKLSLTPGVRLENIWQGVKENVNADKTTVPLADESQYDAVPLFGLGAAYEISDKVETYANISQSYRPKVYTEAVPTGSGQVVNGDLQEGKAWQADVGVRGRPVSFYNWDISYFFMSFKDQIGTSGSTVENVGDAHHQGAELANELDLVGAFDAFNNTAHGEKIGKVNLFANAMVLEAHFTDGPNKGKTPQYAPDFIFKTGVEYSYKDTAKLRLAGTFTDDHFANDTNTSQFLVPSYKVWDLTGDLKVYKDTVSIFGGINNIFDEQYFSRVRADGIDPAAGRNYYAGAKISW